jgi:hypothetical protein
LFWGDLAVALPAQSLVMAWMEGGAMAWMFFEELNVFFSKQTRHNIQEESGIHPTPGGSISQPAGAAQGAYRGKLEFTNLMGH